MSSNDIYCVYAYLRKDGTPYYIGKGQKYRPYNNHRYKGKGIQTPKDKSRIQIIAHRLLESESFLLEIKLIALYGRKDLGTGILRNMTDGGEGGSGYVIADEQRRRRSEQQTGKKKHPGHGENVRRAKIGSKYSEEHCMNISKSNKGKHSMKFGPQSEEHKNNISKANKDRPKPKVTCPHCGLVGGKSAMERWHFNNCKWKTNEAGIQN